MNRNSLKNYKNDQEWIRSQFEYIEEQKAQVNKLNSTLSDMPYGTKAVQDSMAEKIAELMDCFNELLDIVLKEQDKQTDLMTEYIDGVIQV